MSSKWYIADRDSGYGPFSFDQIRQLAKCRMIRTEDILWEEGADESRHAESIDGLFQQESDPKPSAKATKSLLVAVSVICCFVIATSFFAFRGRFFSESTESRKDLSEVTQHDPTNFETERVDDASDLPLDRDHSNKDSQQRSSVSQPQLNEERPIVEKAVQNEPTESEQSASVSPTRTTTLARPIDVISLIDPRIHTFGGGWVHRGNTLSSQTSVKTNGIDSSFYIPVVPTAEYEVYAKVKRLRGSGSFCVGIIAGGRRTLVVVNGHGRQLSAFEQLDGKFMHENETTTNDGMFREGTVHSIRIRVNNRHIIAEFDGRKIIDWEGDVSRLSLSPNMDGYVKKHVPEGRLFITSFESVEILQMTLMPL